MTVLEAEEQIGFHSSGRSATMLHYALGDRLVRALTLASRPFFEAPPDGFGEVPLGHQMPVLIFAREDERAALDALEADIAPFARLERLDARGVTELCPLLKRRRGARHRRPQRHPARPARLLQGNLRSCERAAASSRRRRVARDRAPAACGKSRRDRATAISAPILVNAAGSWADTIAALAGVRPLGLQPKRRTIITFDAPPGTDLDALPFAKTIGDELYFAPESGRLFASPMDEVPSEPCDAQPDEYEVALAAYRMEERTIVKVERIHSRWAGLRTFAPDRHPAVGFAPDADGLLLAGRAGRIRPADLAGDGGDRRFADRGRAVAGGRRRRGRVEPRPLLGQAA